MIRKIAAPLLAVLLVTAGAVGAVGAVTVPGNGNGNGNAPADAGPNDAADENAVDGEENADDRDQNVDATDRDQNVDATDRDQNASEVDRGPPEAVPTGTQSESAADRGPPTDLPGQVPDHVAEIHDAIRRHIDGALSGAELGEIVSGLTPGDGEESDDAAADGNETDTEAPSSTPSPDGNESSA